MLVGQSFLPRLPVLPGEQSLQARLSFDVPDLAPERERERARLDGDRGIVDRVGFDCVRFEQARALLSRHTRRVAERGGQMRGGLAMSACHRGLSGRARGTIEDSIDVLRMQGMVHAP